MATSDDYFEMTRGFGVEDDCPLCGYSFAGCHGLCIAHEAANGMMGPFHRDFNDDCEECGAEKDNGGGLPWNARGNSEGI